MEPEKQKCPVCEMGYTKKDEKTPHSNAFDLCYEFFKNLKEMLEEFKLQARLKPKN